MKFLRGSGRYIVVLVYCSLLLNSGQLLFLINLGRSYIKYRRDVIYS